MEFRHWAPSFFHHPVWQAGHVSGMLVPVGIGITGALMIAGVLYSISMVYRRRRDNFKELRRIVRQPEVNIPISYRWPDFLSLAMFAQRSKPFSTSSAPTRGRLQCPGPGHAAGQQLRRRVLMFAGTHLILRCDRVWAAFHLVWTKPSSCFWCWQV